MGAALKQIDAGVSNVGYAEAGPATGPAVILLHGWPYDIHSFVDVAPDIVVGGLPGDRPVWARLWYHAFSFQRNVPEWPASGTCRDAIALMDALKIQKACSLQPSQASRGRSGRGKSLTAA